MNHHPSKNNITNSEDLLFCSKCHTIPLISILSTNPATVKIYCPCEKRIINIKTYLEEINRNKEKHCLQESHNNISNSFSFQFSWFNEKYTVRLSNEMCYYDLYACICDVYYYFYLIMNRLYKKKILMLV